MPLSKASYNYINCEYNVNNNIRVWGLAALSLHTAFECFSHVLDLSQNGFLIPCTLAGQLGQHPCRGEWMFSHRISIRG